MTHQLLEQQQRQLSLLTVQMVGLSLMFAFGFIKAPFDNCRCGLYGEQLEAMGCLQQDLRPRHPD